MVNFRVTQKIDVIVEDAESGLRQVYSSRIEDIDVNTMTIAAPYRQHQFLPPWPGRKISVRVPAENCAYLFSAILLRAEAEPVALWIITPPADVKKVQVRSYVRLTDVLDVKLELVGEEGDNEIITTLTKDISAGGIKVVLSRPLPAGTKMKITLPLPGVGTLATMGEIIRAIPPAEPGDRHSAAIEFSDIRERDRGEIVKYIFKKQVERRKKEQELFR